MKAFSPFTLNTKQLQPSHYWGFGSGLVVESSAQVYMVVSYNPTAHIIGPIFKPLLSS